jgi:hypothetical protein
LPPPSSWKSRAEALQEVQVAAHLVVEDGDVALEVMYATVMSVLVLVQLAQDAAHGDHVVVRVRAEDDDALPLRQLARPRILEISALNTSPFSGARDCRSAPAAREVVLA